jgi:hypothetical protein
MSNKCLLGDFKVIMIVSRVLDCHMPHVILARAVV